MFLVLFICFENNAKAQEIEKTYFVGKQVINSQDEANPDQFYEQVIEEIIFDEVNSHLEKKGFEHKQKNDLLNLAAKDQAIYMALNENDNIERKEKEKRTTADRIESYGGARNGTELTSKTNIKTGKIPYTYAKIADDIVFKWFTNSKNSALLESYEYNQVGISAKLDEKKRKIYVSLVLGNYKSFNEGAKFVGNLEVPYSEKTYGLTPKDPIFCKKVDRFGDLQDLQKGLSVEGNTIYFETDDFKSLKRLLDKKKDGLAVDILQKEQFSCTGPNVVDHNLVNQGILTKRVFSKKLYNNNLYTDDHKSNHLKTPLGVLPEGISNNYELNLVVIKNKSVCADLAHNFLVEPSGTYTRKIKLLADTVTINSRYQYEPVADSMQLSFKIPFENGKYTYQTEDIEPFLKLLNEPAFVIYDIQITAYSSIEGTDNENKMLQQKRAESIIKALESRQKKIINTRIVTAYNWKDFQTDIQKTQHNILASMKMEEAQTYIRDYNLNKELEPILKNDRYAQIDMKVTYDISGHNERPFVLKKFQNAISDGDKIMALSIEKYIMKQVLNYKYKADVLTEMDIPQTENFAGLIMNKIWLQYFTHELNEKEFSDKVTELYELSPDNEYIAFNDLFLKIKNENFETPDEAQLLQARIDRLYYTPLHKETVDGLNIKLQFKLINYADSTQENEKLKEECIGRIKNIVDISEETLQNSLKLAELFIENKDYDFAIKTLEPWIYHPNTSEELLFAYVSLCSRFEMRMHTQIFDYAMKRARELDSKRFCELFNGQYFSYKVFENQVVKEEYCKYCSTKDKMVDEQ